MDPIQLEETGLLVVDVQRGFTSLCPEELPIPGALGIIPNVNRLLEINWRRIDASQDWHPPNHCSFIGQRDNVYPPHCVMGTPGAEFIPGIHTERFQTIWRKGYNPKFDAYAITGQHPSYYDVLRSCEITTIIICGLATNICCFFAAKDLRRQGFSVFIVEDASAGIDVPEANLYQERAKAEGQRIGIEYVQMADILSLIQSDE